MTANVRTPLNHVGTGAVVLLSAGALALGPVAPVAPVASPLPAGLAPAASSAPVLLAALDSPLAQLLGTVSLISQNIFDGSQVYEDYSWEPYVGIVPELIYTALPIISQLGFNGSAYIGATVDAVTFAVGNLSQAVWSLPSAVITAAGQAIGGDIPGALATLAEATVVPVQQSAYALFSTASDIVTSVITNAINVVATLPTIVSNLATTATGGVLALFNAVVDIGTQTIAALTSLDFETAWNTVVAGLLGPVGADGSTLTSLPGTLVAVTVGPGLGPLGYPDGYAVSSLRMWGEQSQLQIANALGAAYPVNAGPLAPARSKAATVRAAAATDSGSPAEAAADATPDATPDTAADAAPDTAADAGAQRSADQPAKRAAARSSATRGGNR